jgi:CRP/FNR family nitrogen fixation transcriptional regulator
MSVSLSVAARYGHHALHAGLSMPWMSPGQAAEPALPLGGSVLHFAPDRPVYAEGDQAGFLYQVFSGVVRTCQFLSDGRRHIDAFHQAGDMFGFESGAVHRLSAEAVSDCTVVAYRRRRMETVIAGDDKVASHFFAQAMSCLAHTREHCLLLGRSSAAQKIAAFLTEMAERGGSDTVVELAMTRQDIADYLGMTIETVSRTLSQMERDGVIALPTTRRVVLKDRLALRALNA